MNAFTFATAENEMHGVYDQTGKLVAQWRDGDDISHAMQSIFEHFGHDMVYKSLPSTDGEPMPKTISQ